MKLLEKYLCYMMSLHVDIPDYLDKKSEFRITVLIRNLLRRNRIIRTLYRWDEKKKNRGLGAFVIKQYKPYIGVSEKICKYLEDFGFKIIATKELTQEQRDYFSYRPGISEQFWVSDYPHLVVLVYDNNPLSMYKKMQHKWKFWEIDDEYKGKFYYQVFSNMDNLRFLVKNDLRISLNSKVSEGLINKFYVHSVDNSEEAMEYVQKCFQEIESSIIKRFKII